MDKLVQETLKNIDESIEQLNKKKDMTPSELELLCKGHCTKSRYEEYRPPPKASSKV